MNRLLVGTTAVLAFLLVPGATMIGSTEEKVLIKVSDFPLVDRARQQEVDKEIIHNQMLAENEKILQKMGEYGLSFKVREHLMYLIHAIVLDMPSNQVHILQTSLNLEVHRAEVVQLSLDKSTRYVGATKARLITNDLGENLTGKGIKVAIIDTGVDYTHPDLGGGVGEGKKVLGGYNIVGRNDNLIDTDGHGTHVTGIIAANGILKGIAPEASILVYKVVDAVGRVDSINIASAFERAFQDGAKIINLSLGTEFESSFLGQAVRSAAREGVVIVAAAGNSGPRKSTISIPAMHRNVIAVGATQNNVSESLIASLDSGIENFSPTVYPMNGTTINSEGVTGQLAFTKFARKKDVGSMDLAGKIAVAERGGEGSELVFFSEKERNVAERGAIGLMVYNSFDELFQGSLIHGENPPGYRPSIPTVSISKNDGLRIRKALETGRVEATLRISVEPDSIAAYSSRGPESPFYLKPNLVAPGSWINSTYLRGKYKVLSGTSFASPHVAGTAALLLQKYPKLTAEEIVGIIAPSTLTIRDQKGKPIQSADQGSGRLDVLAAVENPVALKPHYLYMHLAKNQEAAHRDVKIKPVRDARVNFHVDIEWSYGSFINVSANVTNLAIDRGESYLRVSARLLNPKIGTYEGLVALSSDQPRLTLSMPLVIHVNNGSISITRRNGTYSLSIPVEKSESGRVQVIGPDERTSRYYVNPTNPEITLSTPILGEYWVDAEIRTSGRTIQAREIFEAETSYGTIEPMRSTPTAIPSRFIEIVFGALGIASISVILYSSIIRFNRKKKQTDVL